MNTHTHTHTHTNIKLTQTYSTHAASTNTHTYTQQQTGMQPSDSSRQGMLPCVVREECYVVAEHAMLLVIHVPACFGMQARTTLISPRSRKTQIWRWPSPRLMSCHPRTNKLCGCGTQTERQGSPGHRRAPRRSTEPSDMHRIHFHFLYAFDSSFFLSINVCVCT